jgi:hypothetical protein
VTSFGDLENSKWRLKWRYWGINWSFISINYWLLFITQYHLFAMSQLDQVMARNTGAVFWLWGFCMMCKLNLLMFQKLLCVQSSLVMNRNVYSWAVKKMYSCSWSVNLGPTAVFKSSLVNSPRTPCRNPTAKKQYSAHCESLESRMLELLNIHWVCHVCQWLNSWLV